MCLKSEQPLAMRPQRLVAFAGNLAQTLHIEDVDVALLVPNETSLLESVGHERYARPSYPEHLGEELLCERDVVAFKQITATQ
jgi:hypothetical protein